MTTKHLINLLEFLGQNLMETECGRLAIPVRENYKIVGFKSDRNQPMICALIIGEHITCKNCKKELERLRHA